MINIVYLLLLTTTEKTFTHLLFLGLSFIAYKTLKDKNEYLMSGLLLGFILMMLSHPAPIEVPLFVLITLTSIVFAFDLTISSPLICLTATALITTALLQGSLSGLLPFHLPLTGSGFLTLSLMLLPLIRKT